MDGCKQTDRALPSQLFAITPLPRSGGSHERERVCEGEGEREREREMEEEHLKVCVCSCQRRVNVCVHV